MSPDASIAVLCVTFLAGLIAVTRRDALLGGFYFFLFVYIIFALVGYAYFPLLSQVLGLYFGPGILPTVTWFCTGSFAAVAVCILFFHKHLVRPGWIGVQYAASPRASYAFLALASLFLIIMLLLFIRDYDEIDYAKVPQMPSDLFAIGFKQINIVALTLWAVIRNHAYNRSHRVMAAALFGASMLLFFAIAAKAGNRTDIVAFGMGVGTFELWPMLTSRSGGLAFSRTQNRQGLLAVTRTVLVGLVALVAIQVNFALRGGAAQLEGVPAYVAVLYNDYFTPAHMLFGSIALDWVRPIEVLQSTLANGFFLGRTLDVPYLQSNIGNVLVPGSSGRSFSFAYYVFSEGYMVAGFPGFLYNGLVVGGGLLAWRNLSVTADRRANIFWAAFSAMFFANIARSQSVMMLRYLFFFGVPALICFSLATGARWKRTES
jgi:hypothetical protein